MSRPAGLLRADPVFRMLWSARAVSGLGDRFSLLAVPILALAEADATPGQVALLWAAQSLPGALLAMPLAAHLVGRPERAIMIVCDLLRPLLLGLLFGLALAGELRLWQLFPSVVAIGLGNAVFEVCAQAYQPRVVDRADYAEANSRVAQASGAADVAGPALAGLLIGFAGARTALLVDAASFLLSAAMLAAIGDRARLDRGSAAGHPWWDRLRDGVRFVRRNHGLRAMVAAFALFNLGSSMIASLWFPYLLDRLGLSASVTGALITAGGLSALGAALAAQRVVTAVQPRVLLPASLGAIVTALWFVPLAATGHPVVLLAAFQVLFSFAVVYFRIVAATVRQSITPADHQGRVYAVVYTFSLLTVPVGGAVASTMAAATSLVTATLTGAAVASTSLLTAGTLATLTVADRPATTD